ncbi:glycosyl hydrolase family 61-domain-containing protein [Pterulicium gracile]|uniref:lytic cellulose monooxygenase (C4-dehydrogenating) n=1 Tax=Pterulicium gracile TaxID=1884261 RepID=A0A5C3QD37_9AGAR|nr:glycosyl hydrolase family 61-domain-containing protein [Pterula gracilis]
MMRSVTCFTLLSLLPSLVAAHGFVSQITVNNKKEFHGNSPYRNPDPSAVRQITGVEPVKGANNPDINCGLGSKIASDVLQVMPGDRLSFEWHGGDGSPWPHNIGPMMTYMASCGDQLCNDFDSTKAKWFKIEQTGRVAPGKAWIQGRLLDFDVPANVTLPGNIQPGNYLIRHEIIALHLGEQKGGAEFYPSCAQLEVGGNGNGKPSEDELVTFPGGYSDDDPGVHAKQIWDVNAKYVYPGPPVAKFAAESGAVGDSEPSTSTGSGSGNGNGGNGNGNGNGNDNDSGSNNDDEGTNDSDNTPSGNGNGNSGNTPSGNGNSGDYGSQDPPKSESGTTASQSCKLKKSSTSREERRAAYKRDLAKYKPKHVSRVMRNIDWSSLGLH